MSKELRNYETIFILDPLLDDDKISSSADKYAEYLTKNGCIIVKTDKWGRKKFTYPIEKKLTGYYISIEFQGEPKFIPKLERSFHLDESVLRYLTISFNKRIHREKQKYFEKKQSDAAIKEKEVIPEEESTMETDNLIQTELKTKI